MRHKIQMGVKVLRARGALSIDKACVNLQHELRSPREISYAMANPQVAVDISIGNRNSSLQIYSMHLLQLSQCPLPLVFLEDCVLLTVQTDFDVLHSSFDILKMNLRIYLKRSYEPMPPAMVCSATHLGSARQALPSPKQASSSPISSSNLVPGTAA